MDKVSCRLKQIISQESLIRSLLEHNLIVQEDYDKIHKGLNDETHKLLGL